MSSRLTDTTSALVQAALRLTAPNQRDDHPHAGDIALEQLILAARDLLCAVDGTEPDKQPAGWSKRAPGSPGWMVTPDIAPDSEQDTDLDDGTCPCENPDDQYVMDIEEGNVYLRHAACGKVPNWGDWNDLVCSGPVPVRAVWESNCTGSHRSGYTLSCDCDYWVQVTLPGESV